MSLERRIESLVMQYAQTPPDGPLAPGLSLRRDLSIDSLSLVALTLRIGDELGIDPTQQPIDLSRLDTVGDLLAFGRAAQQQQPQQGGERA